MDRRPTAPSRVRLAALALLPLVALACADAEGPPLGPDGDATEVASARGGNGNGNGNGGSGGGDAPITDELDPWDPAVWIPEGHPLGRSYLDPANVSQGPGTLVLAIPAGTHDGAEVRSADRLRYRAVEARLRTPYAPGSISAFFFYEGVSSRNDEIDIEIFNDGSRTILFTTWVAGKQTNHATLTLPFDPSAGFHDYRIEWDRRVVRFLVDGVEYVAWSSGVPRDPMYLMSNLWWPTWLSGPPPSTVRTLELDRIIY